MVDKYTDSQEESGMADMQTTTVKTITHKCKNSKLISANSVFEKNTQP